MTRQRLAIVRRLSADGGFLSAQGLHEALDEAGQRVGLSTVYRMLRDLEAAEALYVVRDKRGERLYRARAALTSTT